MLKPIWHYVNDQLNFCKTNVGRVSFFANYNYNVVVRYAVRKEKRRCFVVSPTWSYKPVSNDEFIQPN